MRKNRLIKTFYVLIIGLVMLAAPTAYAVTNDTSVVNSGDDATINSNATQNSSVSVSNVNTADVSQFVNANTNTGGNDANNNIGGGSINTGNAGVAVHMATDANENVTAIDGGAGQVSSNLTDVVNTGDYADISTSTNTNSSIGVSNTNEAFVTQSCGGNGGILDTFLMGGLYGGCNANTGKNDANNNIGGGSITTGNAGIAVGMDNFLNRNATAIGGGLGYGLVNDTAITNTGDDANVNASASNTTTTGVSNVNAAYISQLLNAHANSGYNDANNNIGGGRVSTGNAGIEMLLATNANSNVTGIGYGLSPLLHNIDDVVNTGDDLSANTSVFSNSSAALSSLNSFFGSQYVWEHSNSGYNDTNNNIGAATVGTHLAGVHAGMLTEVNQNSTLVGGLLGSLLSWLL